MRANGAGAGGSDDGERQRGELLPAPSSLAVSGEAAEELLQVCVKPDIPCGSDWMPGMFLRFLLTWPREAELGREERRSSGSQVVCCHI